MVTRVETRVWSPGTKKPKGLRDSLRHEEVARIFVFVNWFLIRNTVKQDFCSEIMMIYKNIYLLNVIISPFTSVGQIESGKRFRVPSIKCMTVAMILNQNCLFLEKNTVKVSALRSIIETVHSR